MVRPAAWQAGLGAASHKPTGVLVGVAEPGGGVAVGVLRGVFVRVTVSVRVPVRVRVTVGVGGRTWSRPRHVDQGGDRLPVAQLGQEVAGEELVVAVGAAQRGAQQRQEGAAVLDQRAGQLTPFDAARLVPGAHQRRRIGAARGRLGGRNTGQHAQARHSLKTRSPHTDDSPVPWWRLFEPAAR